MDRLTELGIVIAIAESGSLAAAARRLGRSPPTVTRILSGLERRTGSILIERSPRRCIPTEAGLRFIEAARTILEQYDAALGSASGELIVPRGNLRITAPSLFGKLHAAPAILRFLDRHGGISIALELADRVADLVGEGFDIAIRIGRVSDPALKVRRIGSVHRVLVASPEYLRRKGRIRDKRDLLRHEMIQHGLLGSGWPFSPKAQREAAMTPRYNVNDAEAAVEAARRGHGIVAALSYQVHDDLHAGSLMRVLPKLAGDPIPVQLVWPLGRERLARLRLLIDFLAEEIGSLEARLADTTSVC